MDQKIYHGDLQPTDVARILAGQFSKGSLRTQIFGDANRVIVQIGTGVRPAAGGQTDMSIILQRVSDGISVQVGQQNYLGVAASLGVSAFAVLRNPLNLIGRINDISADIQHLQLTAEVWAKIEDIAHSAYSTSALSERLRRITCGYCGCANPVGAARCLACGAPLGDVQPHTCMRCGFVLRNDDAVCPNCKIQLTAQPRP